MAELSYARALAQNICLGSGGHGLGETELISIFQYGCKSNEQLEKFCYTIAKCIEHSGKSSFSVHSVAVKKPSITDFTVWHHIDEQWNESWGFEKSHPGCYLYGLYDIPPAGPADFLDPGVVYIGESRSITRHAMLGRRTDFKGTVRNDRLSPYGCGTAFKENFGADKIGNTYQAYLPMNPGLCKQFELELLSEYFKKYGKIPVCNPPLDLKRVEKFMEKNRGNSTKRS